MLTEPISKWLQSALKVFPMRKSVFRVEVEPGQTSIVFAAKDATGSLTLKDMPDTDKSHIRIDGEDYVISPGPRGVAKLATFLMENPPVESESEPEPEVATVVADTQEEEEVAKTQTAVPKAKGRQKKVAAPKAPKAPKVPKARKKKEPVVRAKKTPPPAREIVVAGILARIGMKALPELDTLFQLAQYKDLPRVKIYDLAVFNQVDSFMTATILSGRALNEISDIWTTPNILNTHAEIQSERVVRVAEDVIQHKNLFQPIKVAKLTDLPEKYKDVDKDVYQVWDGRHRVAFFGLLYGADAEIPVMISEMSYESAKAAAITANDTRGKQKTESAFHEFFVATSRFDKGEDQFNSLRGNPAKIGGWVIQQSQFDPDTLVHGHNLLVTEKPVKGTYSITQRGFQSVVTTALSVVYENSSKYKTDYKGSLKIGNMIVDCTSHLYNEIVKVDPQFIMAANAWTSYGSRAYGRLIGAAVMCSIKTQQKFDPSAEAKLIAKCIVSFLKTPEGPAAVTNSSVDVLEPAIRAHAINNALELRTIPEDIIPD